MCQRVLLSAADCNLMGIVGTMMLAPLVPNAGWKTDWVCPEDPDAAHRIGHYNCMAWTIGVTDHEIWPGEPNVDNGCGPPVVGDCDFGALIGKYECMGHPVQVVTEINNAHIACYGQNPTTIRHVARRRAPLDVPEEYCWESKMGLTLRIIHRLNDISFPAVGHGLVRFLRFTGNPPATPC